MLTHVVLVFLAWSSCAEASFLRLVPEFQLTIVAQPHPSGHSTENLLGDININNQGDEAARDVQIEDVDSHTRSTRLESIPAGSRATVHFESPWLRSATFGKFPVALLVHYRDQNGYAFSAPYVSVISRPSTVATPESIPPKAEWRSADVNLAMAGEEFVSLHIIGPIGVHYHVRAFSANEIVAATSQVDFVLDSTGEKDIEFQFKNGSALNNSTYPVYAVVSAERGNGESMVSIATVNVHLVQDFHIATAILVLGMALLLVGIGHHAFYKPRT
jgi:hypothetical protein